MKHFQVEWVPEYEDPNFVLGDLPLGVLNTPILTNSGTYTLMDLELHQAQMLVADAIVSSGIDSAVGHQSTADILTELLRVNILFNRHNFSQQVGQAALILKLNYRREEGAVLDRKALEEIGFKLQLLIRTD